MITILIKDEREQPKDSPDTVSMNTDINPVKVSAELRKNLQARRKPGHVALSISQGWLRR